MPKSFKVEYSLYYICLSKQYIRQITYINMCSKNIEKKKKKIAFWLVPIILNNIMVKVLLFYICMIL